MEFGERECRKFEDVNERVLRARERGCMRNLATTKEGNITNWRDRETRKYGAEEGRREIGQKEENKRHSEMETNAHNKNDRRMSGRVRLKKRKENVRKGTKPESAREF